MNGWMDGLRDRGMNREMYRCKCTYIDWINGWIRNRWMDGWMDGQSNDRVMDISIDR